MECFDVAGGELVPLAGVTDAPAALTRHIHTMFRALMLSSAVSCLGGSSAVRTDCYRFAVYGRMDEPADIAAVARDLERFLRDRPASTQPVSVFVAAFLGPDVHSEADFEAALWRHLDGLTAIGPAGPMPAPTLVDADDPGFVFGDREFFVVGLNPAASRWARRFGWPVLVFNALTHASVLKENDGHARMRDKILARDRNLQGTDNPSLDASQQAQFSGRAVGPDWRKPSERVRHDPADGER